jgi:serine/threonine protein kinase/tetratricopeptide (TPR) repeat protein
MSERDIFEAVVELPPHERGAYLDRICGADAVLRQRLAALVLKHEQAGAFLEQPAVEIADIPADGERPGTMIGPYRLLEPIGEGGFGVVFLAEQTQPVRRQVALKVLKPGMDSRQVVARFEAERQALALMDHPNIAQVFDGGQTATGRPYFAMELVKGVPITEFCDQHQLTPRQRLELFVAVCHAVQHAHQKGIIHRDLKPSNVLVTQPDGMPLVKVIDFGVAKAVGERLTDKTLSTGAAQVIGTPLYMAPEQAALPGVDIDTRSDIYSLGVLLYELLTGTTPFTRERFRDVGYDEMRRIIREEEPPRPSSRVSTLGPAAATVSQQRRSDPKRLRRLCRGELDWIVMKCLEKERDRRYETANGLALDLHRYLTDEPVLACPPSAAYRFRKFARRHKGALSTLSLLGVGLLTLVVVLTVALVAVDRSREETRTALAAEAKRRKQARAALDAMTARVIEQWFRTQDKLGPEQKQLLQTALDQYEDFAADTAQDEESRAGVAHAYRRVGIIRHMGAQYAESEAALERSRQLFAALVADFPDQADYRKDLADLDVVLASAQRGAGKHQAAADSNRRALAAYGQLAAKFPDTPAVRMSWASAYTELGLLLMDLRRLAEAETAHDQAMALFERLVAEFPAAPEYRHELAQTYGNRARVFEATSRAARAETDLGEARAIQERLIDEFPRHPQYRRATALTCETLGVLQTRLGRRGPAEESFRRALRMRKQLAAQYPAVIVYRQELAKSFNNLAVLLEATQRNPEGEEAYRSAIAIQKELALDFPDTPQYRADLARSQNNLGLMLYKTSRREEAAVLYQESLATREQLAAGFPNLTPYRQDLAVTLNNFATLLRDIGRPKDAESAYRRALQLHKGLADQNAADANQQNALAGTMVNLARLLYSVQDYAAARRLLEDAKPYHQAALRVQAKYVVYRSFYRNNRRLLAETLLALNDHAALAVTAGEFLDAATVPAQDAFDTGCFLAFCVRLALDDTHLDETRRRELAKAYGDRSVAALRQAVDRGFRDVAQIEQTRDLEPVRTRADFARLVAEMKTKRKKSTSP